MSQGTLWRRRRGEAVTRRATRSARGSFPRGWAVRVSADPCVWLETGAPESGLS
jgi:hypothetical protein